MASDFRWVRVFASKKKSLLEVLIFYIGILILRMNAGEFVQVYDTYGYDDKDDDILV